jgi:flagellar biogenesis protein FliO
MLPSLLLLSTTVLATPVYLTEVKATREVGHLRVEVMADGGIDPEVARTRIDDGHLFLFLGETRVHADNRAWGLKDGNGEIRAHRHHAEVELDVPLSGNGCSGPVELEGTPTGMTALVGCEGPAAMAPQRRMEAPASQVERRARAQAGAVAAVEVAATTRSVGKAGTSDTATLHHLVALPVTDDDAPAQKPAPAPAPATASEPVAAARPPEAAAKTVQPKPVLAAQAAVGEAAAGRFAAMPLPAVAASPVLTAPATAGNAAPSEARTSLRAVALPALLLAALAVCAYVFARKKRGLGTRRIEILETASLGPKRSLVIARVGDETLVLGASEAGITLLQTSASFAGAKAVEAVAAAAASSNEMDQSLVEALADVPQPDDLTASPGRATFRSIEGGLASLFGRGGVPASARAEPKFDDILEDSVEDQELRQKLAAGMSARVR